MPSSILLIFDVGPLKWLTQSTQLWFVLLIIEVRMSTCWAFFDLYVSLWVAVQNIKAFLTLFHWKKIFILSLGAIWQKNWLRQINFPNREIKLLLWIEKAKRDRTTTLYNANSDSLPSLLAFLGLPRSLKLKKSETLASEFLLLCRMLLPDGDGTVSAEGVTVSSVVLCLKRCLPRKYGQTLRIPWTSILFNQSEKNKARATSFS